MQIACHFFSATLNLYMDIPGTTTQIRINPTCHYRLGNRILLLPTRNSLSPWQLQYKPEDLIITLTNGNTFFGSLNYQYQFDFWLDCIQRQQKIDVFVATHTNTEWEIISIKIPSEELIPDSNINTNNLPVIGKSSSYEITQYTPFSRKI